MEIPKQMAESLRTPPPDRQEKRVNTYSKAERMKAIMVRLWTEMDKNFNPTWRNRNGAIGGETFKAWMEDLEPIGPIKIESGMNAVLDSGNDYPPSLNKFRAMCRQSRGPNYQAPAKPICKREVNPNTPESRAGFRRMQEMFAAIRRGECPETFEESFHKLGLGTRWGALNPNERKAS